MNLLGRVLPALLLLLLSGLSSAEGTRCDALDGRTQAALTDYVAAKYHVKSVDDLNRREVKVANADCYWHVEYEILSSHRVISLYLSPDHKYLVPALYDTKGDPLKEERDRTLTVAKSLITQKAPSVGPENADVTLVEFSDFQCPYCKRMAGFLENDILPSDQHLRVVFKNYPLGMHKWAKQAAQVNACAAMQSDAAFWKVHDYTFAHQSELREETVEAALSTYARQLPGIDSAKFDECVASGFSVGPVMKDEETGNKYGVRSTPTLFVNGVKVEAIRDSAQLKALIAEARRGELTSGVDMSAPSGARVPAQGNGCVLPTKVGQ